MPTSRDPRLVHESTFKPGDIVTWYKGPGGRGPGLKSDIERMVREHGSGPFIVDSVSPVPEYRLCDVGHTQYVRVRRGNTPLTRWTGTDEEMPVSFSGAWFEHS